jgi:hypothetical protein
LTWYTLSAYRSHRIAAALLLYAGHALAAIASDYVVNSIDEPGAPRSKFQYSFGAPAQWPGAIHWRYNSANAPSPYATNKTALLNGLKTAAAKWTTACGVQIVYDGETSVAPNTMIGGGPDRVNVVGWQQLDAGSAGLTYSWYTVTGNGPRVIVDADMLLNPANVTSDAAVARTVTHEWGHFLGLAHSNLANTVMSGVPYSPYSFLTSLTPDDVHGCRCLYGPPAGQKAGNICSLPTSIDFGTVKVGAFTGPTTVSMTNAGNANLTVGAMTLAGEEFSVATHSCGQGRELAPGVTCAFDVAVRPLLAGTRTDELAIDTSEGAYRIPLTADGTGTLPVAPTVDVIEFYHKGLDHYFISSLAADIDALDSGRLSGWVRTGRTFKAYPTEAGGGSPVCRIYIPAAWGDSHFFSASPSECGDTMLKFPQFVLESPAVMYIGLPNTVTGACMPGWTPVYRVWNQRADSNHRYMTDRALRDAMVAQGYVAEGYGPDAVIMCAPP